MMYRMFFLSRTFCVLSSLYTKTQQPKNLKTLKIFIEKKKKIYLPNESHVN